jgi:ABC-type multidrug transport system fused ATPase/permease subunit
MNEDRDLREAPKNMWEYLKQTKETAQACRWVWRELISLKARQWSKWMMGVIFITIILQLSAPFAVQYIFNGLVTTDLEMIYWGFGGYLVCMICCRFTDYFQARAREIVITNAVGEVDQRITELFFEKSMGQHLQESSSLNQANIEKGRSRVMMMIEMLLFNGIDITIRLFLSFLLLWIISPMAGLIMSLVAVIHLAWSLYLNKKVVEDFTPIEKEWRHLNRRRVERWEKMERVKTCGKETEELHEMRTWTSRIIGLDLGFWLWYCLVNNVRHVVAMCGLVVIMAYGVWLVWTGEWMIGLLYPLFMWASIVADNMWHLGRIEQQLNWNVPSVSAMKDALTLKPDVTCATGAPVICHTNPVRVAFDNVSYTYPRGSKEEGTADQKSVMNVICDVTFEIAAGEKIALIGPSGAGKTTIMRLLLRYVDPDQGCIHVNGYKLNELDLSSWMKAIGYIPQQPQVLDGTIRYNLTYGLPNELPQMISSGS